ncbi:divalent-cation tolerance protein CutA [Candidatus Micrarchaeota archaeon]|nr:divalent-cation tolerance protein CutA [Candidatus Micrarchaeota archaeon]
MIIILTTVPKQSDGEKLAKLLVEKKLAACVNIIKIEKSIFRWKGNIVENKEFLLIIKSTAEKYNKLERTIKKNHPYKLPEIVRLKVDGGLRKYLDWVARPR